LRNIFSYAFRKADYEVRGANNGMVALRILEDETYVPRLIVLDIDMPYVNGFSVMNYVRSQRHLALTKIIVVTGNDVASFSGESEKADLWLIKPVGVTELITLAKRFSI
jgi:DNA-binding response OmpR family regulator